MIIGPHFKLSPFGRNPIYSILTSLPYSERIQQLKKRRNQIHLLVMHWSDKKYIPLKISILELHMICHPRVLTMCNTKQVRIRNFQMLFPISQIMPKPDLDPSPTLYLTKLEKTSHPLLIYFHSPTPKGLLPP